MAFGLYLTRVSLGEIVKTESFLKDSAFLESSSTRFSVEIKGGLDRPGVADWISKHVEGTADLSKVKLPFTVADHLTVPVNLAVQVAADQVTTAAEAEVLEV